MKILELMAAVPLAWEPPSHQEGTPLVDSGLLCVLARHLTDGQAHKTLRAFRRGYEDWNELRVSQVQEFQGLVASKSSAVRQEVATDVRAYLREVFQKNHGFDLEHLRGDPTEAAKFLSEFVFLGGGAAHYLLWLAGGGAVPVSTGVIRVLDRTGSMKRTSSIRRAQGTLDPIVAPERRADFGVRLGTVVQRWCDSKKPLCWNCPLCEGCPFGKRVHRDWKAQQKRHEIQRKKDKDRRRREEERQRQRAAAQAKREAAEFARKRAQTERIRQQEEARRARVEEKKKAAAQREAERRKKVEAKKKEEAAKKAAAKKAAAKQAAAKKAAAKKAAAKKATAEKATAKRATAKRATAKRATAKKTTGKNKAAKKPTKKKASTSGGRARKAPKSSAGQKKPATKKKPAARKKTKSRSRKR